MAVFEQVMSNLQLNPRPQQVRLAALSRAAVAGRPVFAQAGTGTGKSYVVLSQAVEFSAQTKRPSVVICPTNALVDQYVHKDAPRIGAATGATFTHLKGRSNYLCASSRELSRYDDPAHQWRALVDARRSYELAVLKLSPAEYGCPGSKVCDGEACGALLAREAAVNYDVVITNAHVLVWDKRVRDFTKGSSGLLPEYGALLVDECHELEPSARGCLSDEIGPGSVVYTYVPQFKSWVQRATRELDDEQLLVADAACQAMISTAKRQISFLEREISAAVEDGCDLRDLRSEYAALERFVSLFEPTDEYGARYLSLLTPDRVVKRSCIDASGLTRDILTSQPAILVSGTVPTSLPTRLGVGKCLADGRVHNTGHPFDYSKSVLVVSRFDVKKASDHPQRVTQLVRAIRDTGGGTLVLFTSWADLESVMTEVYRKLDPAEDIPIYLQSRDDPTDTQDMIRQFREHGNGVLAGVATLFTGIDVPGSALRQVVLWKLPYPVPTHEFRAIEEVHGRQVYFDEMLIRLTQGIGRLVRTADDCGRVVILDSRAKNQRWASSAMTSHLAEFATGGAPPLTRTTSV